LQWWQVDLTDAPKVGEVVSAIRPELIFHLASHVTGSRDSAQVIPTLQNNLVSTVNLLVAAASANKSCHRFILAGSMEEPLATDGEAVPCSPYAATKWAAGGYARMFHSLYGLETITVRIYMAYGPGQMDGRKLIPYVTQSLLRGEAPKISSGSRLVDWVFVEDIIEGLLAAALTTNIGGAAIDIGSGMPVTIRELVERLVCRVNPSIRPIFGAVVDRACEPVRFADTATTERQIGWRPLVALDEGLGVTVDWYRRRLAGGSHLGGGTT
jgi:nucleoside-diphosphate-sugar epimerase